MKTIYQVLNIDLANQYTKKRKIEVAKVSCDEILLPQVLTIIESMDIPEDDDRYHWITSIGKKAAADLLTLGKVQPETMLEMGNLPEEDFREAVKVATSTARKWNEDTIAAEQELNTDTVDESLV
jgi:hypothetical protein